MLTDNHAELSHVVSPEEDLGESRLCPKNVPRIFAEVIKFGARFEESEVPSKIWRTVLDEKDKTHVLVPTEAPPVNTIFMDIDKTEEGLHVIMLSECHVDASLAVNPMLPTMLCKEDPKTPEIFAEIS